MAALVKCNEGMAGSYGIDDDTAQVEQLLQKTFETTSLQSFPVACVVSRKLVHVLIPESFLPVRLSSSGFSRAASCVQRYPGLRNRALTVWVY